MEWKTNKYCQPKIDFYSNISITTEFLPLTLDSFFFSCVAPTNAYFNNLIFCVFLMPNKRSCTLHTPQPHIFSSYRERVERTLRYIRKKIAGFLPLMQKYSIRLFTLRRLRVTFFLDEITMEKTSTNGGLQNCKQWKIFNHGFYGNVSIWKMGKKFTKIWVNHWFFFVGRDSNIKFQIHISIRPEAFLWCDAMQTHWPFVERICYFGSIFHIAKPSNSSIYL